MFTQMLEQSMTVKRLQASTGIKRVYATLGPFPCLLQPLDDQKAALHGLAMGNAYQLYCDVDANVKDGDQVTVGTQTLKVSGTKVYNFGDYQHKELLVYTEVSNS